LLHHSLSRTLENSTNPEIAITNKVFEMINDQLPYRKDPKTINQLKKIQENSTEAKRKHPKNQNNTPPTSHATVQTENTTTTEEQPRTKPTKTPGQKNHKHRTLIS
jgi:uncharacterized protein YdiU (UPF0061 family)